MHLHQVRPALPTAWPSLPTTGPNTVVTDTP